MKSDLALNVVVLVLISPYLLLFYKKENIRIRLLFVSMIEIFFLCALITIDFLGHGVLTGAVFFYNSYVWMSVLLNFILIFFSWVFKKTIRSKI